MTPAQAYEEDVSRCPIYDDGGARPHWHEIDFLQKKSWEKNPTPRGFEFCGVKTCQAHREYMQGQAHAKQGHTDLVGQSPAYDRGHSAVVLTGSNSTLAETAQ